MEDTSPNFINNSPLAEVVSDLLLNEIKYFTSTVERTELFTLAVLKIQTIKCLAGKNF